MLISISVVESEPEDHSVLTSLFRWLKQDLGADAQLSLQELRIRDAQGGAFAAVNALIGDGVGLAGLALSYATWRQAHRSPKKIRFERDGVAVVVEDASPESLRLVEQVLGGQPADVPDGRQPGASDPALPQ